MASMNLAQQIRFTLTPTKADGTPGTIDGLPTYTVSDPTVLSVVLDDPAVGTSGKVVGIVEGSARVAYSADADMGAGVTTISGESEDVAVTADPANQTTGFAFAFGAPEPLTP